MNINIFKYLFLKLLQKMSGASRKFDLPKVIQNVFYELHLTYMNYLLKPYFIKSERSINNCYKFRGTKNSSIIWMFWWQGTSHMPHIVKHCINSVKRNSGNHKVILITKQNIHEYSNLSKIIYLKLKDGKLDLTHFSDILRFNLLNRYGGLWIDSTVYCTGPINNNYFNYIYTSGGYNNTSPKFVKGRWTEFLIGGNSKNNMLAFVDSFLQLYFSKNNWLLSYFMADYALNYAYNHNLGCYKNYVNNVADGENPHLFKLIKLLNKPFDSIKFRRICRDTNMFKLTYKEKFDNNNTFYAHLINNDLY